MPDADEANDAGRSALIGGTTWRIYARTDLALSFLFEFPVWVEDGCMSVQLFVGRCPMRTPVAFQPLALLLAGISFSSPLTAGETQAFAPVRPHIILVMADDLGWGDVGYNGNNRIKTPNLDAMAAEGLILSRFYAASPVCSPTRGSVLTGRHPHRYGVTNANVGHLRAGELTLAELLKGEGYRTGHFGKWHLGTLDPEFSGRGKGRRVEENYMTPGMAGFDEWFSTEYAVATFDPYVKVHGVRSLSWSERLLGPDRRRFFIHNGVPVAKDLAGETAKIVMDRALLFIEETLLAGQPVFAVVWLHAPHVPLIGVPAIMRRHYARSPEYLQRYASTVTGIDAQIGRLRARLRDLGVAGNTFFAFTSDNGPSGMPRPARRPQGSAGSFRGRKGSLYEGGVRVPSLIEWPDVIKEPRQSDVLSVTSDYLPTITDILDIQLPDRPYDGQSLLPVLKGREPERSREIGFVRKYRETWTGRRLKLVRNLNLKRNAHDNGKVPVAPFELYDLKADPGETRNIADRHPETVLTMASDLAKWRASLDASAAGVDYADGVTK